MKIILFLLLLTTSASAQVYFTRTGKVHFFSQAPLEDIEAVNDKAEMAFEATSGRLNARIPITAFEFPKKLMQQHFNENYLESDKYPYAVLDGKIDALPAFDKDGTFPVSVAGSLTLHGVKKEYTFPGKLEIKGGKPVRATSEFEVKLVDHKIEIPTLVVKKIAEVVKVDVDFPLQLKTK